MKYIKYLMVSFLFVGCAHTDTVNVPQDCDTVRNNDNSVTLVCKHHLNTTQKGK